MAYLGDESVETGWLDDLSGQGLLRQRVRLQVFETLLHGAAGGDVPVGANHDPLVDIAAEGAV